LFDAICDNRIIRLGDLPADIRRYAPQLCGESLDADRAAGTGAKISLKRHGIPIAHRSDGI
jgi:hypothetical protein